MVLEAHKPAVWAVAGLHEVDGSRRILSCETMGWRIRVLGGWSCWEEDKGTEWVVMLGGG